jgi:phage tail protein X
VSAGYGQPARLQITLQRYHPDVVGPAAPPGTQIAHERFPGAAKPGQPRSAPAFRPTREGRIEGFRFPVNPENIDIRFGREVADVSLLLSGTHSRPGLVTPAEISFASFLPDPATTPSGLQWLNVPADDLVDPWTRVKELREWQKAAGISEDQLTPLKLTIADTSGQVYWVTMTQLDIQTRPGPGDVYFTATFREVSELPDLRQVRQQRVNPKPATKHVTSRAGENLTMICKRHYGRVSPAIVAQVYAVNKKAVGPDRQRKLPAGVSLVMPKLAAAGK